MVGQLAVAADEALGHVGHDLLVGHGQEHVAAGAILEARHVGADGLPAAGLLPQFGRVDDGQGDFLAADGVHLLAEDVLDLVLDAQGEGQEIEDAGGDLVDHAGAQQELMADDVGVGGHLAQGLEEEFRDSHRAPRQKQRIGQGKRRLNGRLAGAPPGV